MADPEITIDTPTEAVKDNRANLVRLARTVFGRMETGAMRAFSQFQKNSDLIRLIDAKRAGTFDYGAHVTVTPAGFAFPNADDAMKLLDAALTGGAKIIQMPVQQPAAEPAKPPRTQARQAPVTAPVVEEKKGVANPPLDVTPLGPLLERIERMEDGFRTAFQTLDGRVMGALLGQHTEMHSLLLGARGLVGMLDTVMARQKVIASYLDEYAELPDISDEMRADLGHLMGLDAGSPASPSAPVQTAPLTDAGPGPEAAPPVVQAPVVQAQVAPVEGNGLQTVTYTKEDLTAIGNRSLSELQAIAESVGVPNPQSTTFVSVLVARVLSFQLKVK